jgi:ion channel POLLUX/CASTOR
MCLRADPPGTLMANPRRRTARMGQLDSRAPRKVAARTQRKVTLRERLQYGFDNTMSRGTPALVGWLALVTLAMVAVFTAIVLIANLAPAHDDGKKDGIIGQAFKNVLHALDPGTVAGDTGSWEFLLTMFVLTVVGLFIVSALIGVIATGLDNKIQDLRKGRSFVIEKDHTLILGWSESIYTILSELRVANENESKPVVVVLAEKDRVEMEDLIRAKIGDMGKTRVVCRTGNAIDLDDLAVANPEAARSIIVLSPEDEDPDAQVIKTVLALNRGPIQRADRPHRIVAEIQDPANLEAARLVGGDETVIVDKSETISRLIVQTARQSGLSIAYTELLDFDGDEIYFRPADGLAGRTFREALHAFEECSVIGLQDGDGRVRLNPPADTAIDAGAHLIAIAEDDEKLLAAASQSPNGTIDEALIVARSSEPPEPQSTLLLGWNHRAPAVIVELDKYVAPGSSMMVVASYSELQSEVERSAAQLDNIDVKFRRGETTDRATLEQLGVDDYDHVIVLCYSDELDAQRADARTLVTLLHLRDIASKTGGQFTIVSELLDDRDRQLAEVTQVDDVIVSDKVISLLLTQISENPHLSKVFAELFAAEGSELYLRPADQYLKLDEPTTFRTVVESAIRRGEVAIGYRTAALAHDADAAFGVAINPPKSQAITPAAGDRVVVLAED